MKCPGFEQLIEFLDNRLAGLDALSLKEHLASNCQQCAKDLRWYERVRAIAASDDSTEPPQWVINRAVRLFEIKRSRPDLFDRLGQLVATLIFDSFARPVPSDARAVASFGRQLLYRAGLFSIDLQIALSEKSSAALLGQVLCESEHGFDSVAGLALNLIQDSRVICSGITNEMGEFTFHALDYGYYDLLIETRETTITIPRLPFAPRS